MGKWLGRRARRLAAITAMAAVTATLAAGCGGSGSDASHVQSTARTGATRPATIAKTTPAGGLSTADLQRGRSLFRASCGACHTLRDAGTHGTRARGEAVLDPIHPNVSSVKQFVSHGYGGMPSFRGKLTPEDIDLLARYVATVDGCGTRSPTSCDPR